MYKLLNCCINVQDLQLDVYEIIKLYSALFQHCKKVRQSDPQRNTILFYGPSYPAE